MTGGVSAPSSLLLAKLLVRAITVGSSTVALNTTTCPSDGVANTVSDGTGPTPDNWFIVNTYDKATKQAGETATTV